jgi:pimeloyl-ACP methyl ester carboxylesterase
MTGDRSGVRWSWLAVPLFAIVFTAARSDAGPIEAREVSFESSGFRLLGTLTRPADGQARAGVVIFPGSGPLDRDGASRTAPSTPPVYRQWAERLSEAGFAVLRYDKRFLTHPGIDIAALDEEAQIADALSAVLFLRSAPGGGAQPILLIGHSEGGTLAPIVAERAGAIAGVVIVNAALFPIDELLVEQLQANPTVGREAIAEVKHLLAGIKDGSFPRGGLLLGAGAGYWAQWIRYSTNAAATLSGLRMPLLVVQCLSDETLPGHALARNLAVARAVAAANRNAQLRELPGHDHLGMRSGEREPSVEFMAVLFGWLGPAARTSPR